MEQWLVRTEDYWIAGPFSRQTIQEMILNLHLKPKDEICAGNGGDWIYLDDFEEVKRQLGIDLTGSDFTDSLDQTKPLLTHSPIFEKSMRRNCFLWVVWLLRFFKKK